MEVPARAAAGLRVGCNDLHAGFDEVVPILDVLGIALADEEYNGGCVWRAIVWQAALPILGQRCRSVERRVGKECVSTCRSRWSQYHYKKNKIQSTSRQL